MTGRMFRDGIPSTCAAPKVCPGPFDAAPHHYDSYTFTNTTGSTQCVTVTDGRDDVRRQRVHLCPSIPGQL